MRKITLTILLVLLTGLTGCSVVRLHPILQQDIVVMKKGTTYTADRDGYFLSEKYIKEVMDTKVERKRLR